MSEVSSPCPYLQWHTVADIESSTIGRGWSGSWRKTIRPTVASLLTLMSMVGLSNAVFISLT
jgi:hypothetical protein